MSNSTPNFLNTAVIDAIDPVGFRAQNPFPWVNPQYFIRDELYPQLLATMPDVSRFRAFFGKQRKHGQASHDRYVLDYEDGMELAAPWDQLIAELRGESLPQVCLRHARSQSRTLSFSLALHPGRR